MFSSLCAAIARSRWISRARMDFGASRALGHIDESYTPPPLFAHEIPSPFLRIKAHLPPAMTSSLPISCDCVFLPRATRTSHTRFGNGPPPLCTASPLDPFTLFFFCQTPPRQSDAQHFIPPALHRDERRFSDFALDSVSHCFSPPLWTLKREGRLARVRPRFASPSHTDTHAPPFIHTPTHARSSVTVIQPPAQTRLQTSHDMDNP